MPVPSEEQFEAEQGFDYSYDRTYDYGLSGAPADAGTITAATATPLTSAELKTPIDGGTTTAVAASPLTSAELRTPLDGGATTAVAASPLTSAELRTPLDGGATTAVAASPLTSAELRTPLDGGTTTAATVSSLASPAERPTVVGGITATTATPLPATELRTPLDGGATTPATASPLTSTELRTPLDGGAITRATVTPLTVTRRHWHINGRRAIIGSLSVEPSQVSLSFEIPASDRSTWRQYDRAGDVSVESAFGGQFRALDRGGRASPTLVQPPGDQSPPLVTDDYFVTGYQESQRSADRIGIDLTCQRLSNRATEFATLSESGDWEFSLETGTVGLDASHVGRASGSGTTSGPEYDLTLTVSDDQAAALLDNWGYPDGVVERGVGDGTNFLVDESPSSRQTVTISGPSGAILPDGDYLVTSWQVKRAGFDADRRWVVDVTLAEG